jgi:ketosteroid isomerase-like protein
MSEENVEVVRRAYESFQAGLERGDPGAPFDLGLLADDSEWIIETDAPIVGRRVWRGREGFLEFMRTWTEQFDDWSFQVERLVDVGDDRVVALTHQSATGRESGVPVELNVGEVWEFEEGRLVRVRNYRSQAEALEAARLSE